VVGPSYVDIANKYAPMIKYHLFIWTKSLKEVQVFGKFTNGCSFIIDKDEAKSMVKYILLKTSSKLLYSIFSITIYMLY
jgi:cytochrome c551/c552